MLNIGEIEQLLFEIQKDQTVFKPTIGNYSLWCILKRPIFYNLISNGEKLAINNPVDTKRKIYYIVRIIKSFFQILRFMFFRLFNSKQPTLFFTQSYRRFSRDGKYYEPYIDGLFIEKGLKLNAIGIDNLKAFTAKKPYSKKIQINENIIKAPLIKVFINKKIVKEIDNAIKTLYEILNNIDIVKSKKINLDFLFNAYTRNRVLKFIVEKKRSEFIFKCLKPKLIIIVSSEGHLGMIAAAKKLNIPVIEQQHGLISKHHPIYDWPSFFKNKKVPLCVPDYIFTYGNYWSNILKTSGYWDSKRLFSSGSYKFSVKTKGFKKEIPAIKKTLLYSANPNLSFFEINFFLEFIKLYNNQHIKIVIKLHPSTKTKQDWEKLMQLYPDNITVFLDQDADIFDLYKTCDFHLSAYSFAVFESLALQIVTITFNRFNSHNAIELINQGLLASINTPQELISLLSNHDKLSKLEATLKLNQSNFFSIYDTNKQFDFIQNII